LVVRTYVGVIYVENRYITRLKTSSQSPPEESMSSGRYVSALIIELTNLIKTNKTANAIRYGKAIKLKTKVTDKPRVGWVCL